MKRLWQSLVIAGCWMCIVKTAHAQSSSLYGTPEARQPLTLEGQSWIYLKVEPPREVQLNDIVTVRVNDKWQALSSAQLQRRTQSNANLILQNWIKLDGIGIADNTPSVSPEAQGQVNTQARTTTQLNGDASLVFRITARIVDIRPNGQLVIEAHDTIQNNEEIFEQSLAGIIRREDILPNNEVDSEKINELKIVKRDKGHVAASVRRGWVWKIYDMVKPF